MNHDPFTTFGDRRPAIARTSVAIGPMMFEMVPAPFHTTELTLPLSSEQAVSALHTEAPDAFACLVLAHGAGAGMRHKFMAAISEGLAHRGVSTLRYQFPYMEAGSKRVDRPPVAHLTVRTAVTAVDIAVPLFAGGKSFGGRMTSQAQAIDPLPGIRGLVFFGFPLHPAGKPSIDRAAHLSDIRVPMLFLQGTRDALADMGLIERVVGDLGPGATLFSVADADHSFHVPAKTGHTDAQILDTMLSEAAAWMREIIGDDHKQGAAEDSRCRIVTGSRLRAKAACHRRRLGQHCAPQQALRAGCRTFPP